MLTNILGLIIASCFLAACVMGLLALESQARLNRGYWLAMCGGAFLSVSYIALLGV